MPCSDVTELIRLSVDFDDRLVYYQVNKKTCGAEIGAESLLLAEFRNRPIDELMAIRPDTLLDYMAEAGRGSVASELATATQLNDLEEFLTLKHLFAVQTAIGVLTGVEPADPSSPCAVAEILCEEDRMTVVAHLQIDVLTEKIKSCGGCGSCGKSKKAAKAAL